MPNNAAADPEFQFQFLSQLRNWHAKAQFMPWVHPTRLIASTRINSTAGADLDVTAGAPLVDVAAGGVSSYDTDSLYQRLAAVGAGNPWAPVRDMKGMQSFNQASIYTYYNTDPDSMTGAGRPNMHQWLEYDEAKKGPLDNWLSRRARRMPPLGPGEAYSFTRKTRGTVAPVRMGIPGLKQSTAGGDPSDNPLWNSLTGLGFDFATRLGGCGLACNVGVPSQAARPLHCRKTDPLGSAGTAAFFTLEFRGNTLPLTSGGTTGRTAGAFTEASPVQLLVKQETQWFAKVYVKRVSTRRAIRQVWNNQNATATDALQYVQTFPTAPASVNPVQTAQA